MNQQFKRDTHSEVESVEVTHAVINVDEFLAARIRQLSKAVRDLGVYAIEEFNYTPHWYGGDPSAEEGQQVSMDAVRLVVRADEFVFAGYEKHTDIEALTRPIKVGELTA